MDSSTMQAAPIPMENTAIPCILRHLLTKETDQTGRHMVVRGATNVCLIKVVLH